jgi:hypothetical protein
VEGPSDRIYLRAWIRLQNPELEEGTDYSIMFYGGRLLNHLSADDSEVSEFISLRKLNRHLCVVIDSDKTTANSRINSTKKRVKDEWGPHSGFAWVTAGREIENYVEPEAMLDALNAVAPGKRHALNTDRYAAQISRDRHGRPVADKLKVAHWLVENNRLSLDRLDLRRKIEQICTFIAAANQSTSGVSPTVG